MTPPVRDMVVVLVTLLGTWLVLLATVSEAGAVGSVTASNASVAVPANNQARGDLRALVRRHAPLPAGSDLRWVMADVVHNGRPQRVLELRSSFSVSALIEHWQRNWSSQSDGKPGSTPAYVEASVGDWRILSRRIGALFLTIQLREYPSNTGADAADHNRYNSQGYVSFVDLSVLPRPVVNSVAARQAEWARALPGFSLPPGFNIVSTTAAVATAGQAAAVTFLLSHPSSSRISRHKIETGLAKSGWALLMSDSVDGIDTLFFNRDQQRCDVTVVAGVSGSLLTLNVHWSD